MTKQRRYTTPAGRVLTAADLDAIAEEVERRDYPVDQLKSRRRGRPLLGSAPAEVVSVRLGPELKRAVDARAEAERLSASEIIRRAVRRYLDIAG
jgi:hypothetical protein